VIAGRPNVGKSTLVNRIIGRQEAIVEEHPGVTRDRKTVAAEWAGRQFSLVDTGGWLTASGTSLDAKVSQQAEQAMRAADLVLMVVDATVGITAEDERVAAMVRRLVAPALLVVNKVDSEQRELDIWPFLQLGLGDPIAISALHGRGTGDALDEVVARLPVVAGDHDDDDASPVVPLPEGDPAELAAVAIVGRPNVGKSTLFNRLIGEERAIVHDLPGTTRDSIDTVVDTPYGRLRFVDTAGMRRKSRIGTGAEYYSLVRALQAIDRADAAILVIAATEGVTHQDQRLAERIDAAGSPIVIAMNKWEVLDTEDRETVSGQIADRLGFLAYAPVLRLSALTGKGVHRLGPALEQAIAAYHSRVPTRELNKVVQQAQAAHAAPGARVLYATQGATDPPTFTLFTTRRLPAPYLRYLEGVIREAFDFGPTPLKFRVRRRTE
jgi:GTP-binding protein